MLEFMFCGREFRNGTVEGILLMISSGDFVEMTGDVVIKVSSLGVGFIVALCKVGDKFNWQQGRVGVGKSSHGGVEGCALSVLSFSIGNTNVGLVFSISTSVVSVSKRWGVFSKCVISDCSLGEVFMLGLDCCVVRTELIISLSSI
jgi:homoaconitase/3-isopropylmalate dehydratase large subunit